MAALQGDGVNPVILLGEANDLIAHHHSRLACRDALVAPPGAVSGEDRHPVPGVQLLSPYLDLTVAEATQHRKVGLGPVDRLTLDGTMRVELPLWGQSQVRHVPAKFPSLDDPVSLVPGV